MADIVADIAVFRVRCIRVVAEDSPEAHLAEWHAQGVHGWGGV